MKKVLVLLLFVSLVAFQVFGGGAKEVTSEEGPITLTFMRTGTPEVLRGIFEPIIAEFEAENPGIKIDMQDLGWSDAEKTLQTMAASQTLPDLMYHLPGTIFDLADKGLILDLAPYIDEELRNDMYPSMMEAGQYKGKQYMMTTAGMTLMMWYHTEIFERAGLDPNSPPKTWDELLESVAAIDKLDGVSGIGMYGKAGGGETSFVFESLFTSAFEGAAWNSATSRYVYDTPEGKKAAIEALTMIQKLVPFAQDNVVEFGRFDCRTMIRDGKVGIVLDGVNLANQVKNEMAAGTIKAALLPAASDGIVSTAVNVGGWYIPTNSKHPDEAWRFLRYLMKTENQVKHAQYGSVPILKSEAAYYEGDAYKATVSASVNSSFAEGVSPQSNALWLSTGEQLQRLILGMQSPSETIENINKEHKNIYK